MSAMSTQFNKYAALDVRSFGSNSTVAINAKGKNDFLSFSRWRRAISLPFSRHTHSTLYLVAPHPFPHWAAESNNRIVSGNKV